MRWPRVTAAVLLGGLLLWLGAPRLLAALALLPGDPLLDAVHGEERLDPEQVSALLSSRQEAQRFVSAPSIDIETGLALLLAAQAAPEGSAERDVLLDRAVESLKVGLSQGPRDAFAWAKLAYALLLDQGMSAAAIDAWRMSIVTAPAESRLVLWRSEFGAQALPLLDAGDQARLAGQMRLAWRFDRESLARMGRERGLQLVLRRVLSGEPDAAELNRLFAQP